MIDKKFNLLLCMLIIFSFFSLISLVEAKSTGEDLIKNINIDIDSPSVVRTGNEIILILRIDNMNEDVEDEELIIKKIEILDYNGKKIKQSNYDNLFKSSKKEMDDLNKIVSQIQKGKLEYSEEELERIVSEIQENRLKERFVLNLNDFKSSLEVGDVINILIEVKVRYDDKDFVVNANHPVLISEPLPSPPHNSPGWYKGDQHVHSEEILNGRLLII